MTRLSSPGLGALRKLRLRRYQAVRARFEGLSDTDLADMGVKRYQLGHMSRVEALK
jgi:uncharacterized protein YjiS (DUF1127 family)